MKSLVEKEVTTDSKNVLLIGNNPTELSTIYDRLSKATGMNFITEIVFDVKHIVKKVMRYRPNFIIIDDNLSKKEMKDMLRRLKSNVNTMGIPITIVQNSNSDDTPREGAEEFILKEGITSESISRSLMNSLKFSQMRSYLSKAYSKRKRILNGL